MQIYLVGGAVRDKLLNYPCYDHDWVVVGADAEEMLNQGYTAVGQDFPVFIHPESGEEYALARTERKSGKGYTGFQYFASKDVSLEEDLMRRDLTINAMAMDANNQIHDPYKGQADLQNKILRHVSPAFSEDPLRVLRVARFAARYHHLGFRVATETIALMRQLSQSDELEYLTAERVWKEFERALSEQSPEVFLSTLKQCDAAVKVFPELDSALNETSLLQQFQQCCSRTDKEASRFACLLSLCQLDDVESFCDRLRSPKAYKELALFCRQHHESLAQFDVLAAAEKLNLIQKLDLIRRPQRLELLEDCCQALHDQYSIESLAPTLKAMSKIEPQKLIKEGFKGAELGREINQRRLAICEKLSTEAH